MELSKLYFEQLGENDDDSPNIRENEVPAKKQVHQCSNCLTVYDTDYGDALNEIPQGITFESLPDDYKCSVCESEKKSFISVAI